MIKEILDLSKITPLNRMQIEHLVHLAGKFSSRILFEHENRTINGKSMLGLLSMGITGGKPVILTVEGEDEEIAAQEIKRLLDSGVAPAKEANDAMALMQIIKDRYALLLHDNLVGIYLHGSLAAGCFQWDVSDIDFLVVVRKSIPVEKKIALVECLYALRRDAPPKGFEMSVLLEENCRAPIFPVPYELHFSPRWMQEYERSPRGFCERMHGEDMDLTAHILNLHTFGVPVLGPSVARVFGQVKREDALCAIRQDTADSGEHLHEQPIYYVLNLCRALAYKRDQLVLSKKQGGEWGLKNLSHAHQAVIQAALNAYQSGRDMFYDRGQAEDFCYDVMEELNG
ncbi:MAG: DUF4111 domain-containing protein [Clostridia bacterium]|nr:DUF4111 domain-containing protein [Clostridia bacterium]